VVSPPGRAGLGCHCWEEGDPPQPSWWEQANILFVFNVFLLQNIERSLEALGIKVRSPGLLGWGLFLLHSGGGVHGRWWETRATWDGLVGPWGAAMAGFH